MLHLHSIKSGSDKRFQSLTPPAVARMRPYCQSARFMRDADRIFDRQLRLRHERATACTQKSRERIPKIVGSATRDHRPRDMRPPHRATVGLLENFIDETERRTWFLFEASRDADSTGH